MIIPEIEYTSKPGINSVEVVVRGEKSSTVLVLYRWPEMDSIGMLSCFTHVYCNKEEQDHAFSFECQYSPTGFCRGGYEEYRPLYKNVNVGGFLAMFAVDFDTHFDISTLSKIKEFLTGKIMEV